MTGMYDDDDDEGFLSDSRIAARRQHVARLNARKARQAARERERAPGIDGFQRGQAIRNNSRRRGSR